MDPMSVANLARESVESLSSFAEAHDNPTGANAGATARVSDTDKNARSENAPDFNPLPVANTSSSVEHTAADPRGTGNNTQDPYADYYTELAKFKGKMSSRTDAIEKNNQILLQVKSAPARAPLPAQDIKRPRNAPTHQIAMRSVREYYNDGIAKLSQPPVTVVSTQHGVAGQETSSSAANANPSRPLAPSETQNSFTLTLEDMSKNMTLQLQKITRANNFMGLINVSDPSGHLNVPWETLRAKYQKRRRTNADVTAVSYVGAALYPRFNKLLDSGKQLTKYDGKIAGIKSVYWYLGAVGSATALHHEDAAF
ncbi:hypothetical protein FALBO_15998, partial [Fusarium albosuccineum]